MFFYITILPTFLSVVLTYQFILYCHCRQNAIKFNTLLQIGSLHFLKFYSLLIFVLEAGSVVTFGRLFEISVDFTCSWVDVNKVCNDICGIVIPSFNICWWNLSSAQHETSPRKQVIKWKLSLLQNKLIVITWVFKK